MKKYKLLLLPLIFALIFVSCEDKSDLTSPGPVNTGDADFTRFYAIGNSLTAGYQSSSLYESAQKYSYGKQIANQVNATFEQPLVADPGIGGRIDVLTVSPFVTTTQPEVGGLPTNSTYAGVYNNMGIPGIVVGDVLQTTSSPSPISGDNPLIDVILRGQGSVISQVLGANPTFLTVWIGNNDILGYATSGGLLPYTPTEGAINFAGIYTQLLGAIAQAGVTDVVVANIPDVSAIPFFTTVGGQLLLDGVTQVVGTKSDNSVAPLDLTKNLLTLRASEELAAGKGLTPDNPLSNGVILDEDEIAIAKSVIASYNSSISNIAAQFGFHVVDMNAFFNDVAANGLVVDGVPFSTIFVNGGLFSLDGVHPTSQGYAIIANKFIEVINENFSADIPMIDVTTIPGSLNLAKQTELTKIGMPYFSPGTFNSIFH